MDDDACYRAMDVLVEIEDELARQVFWQLATLLDLSVDLVFFDSTSTYWHRDTAADPVARDQRGEPVAPDSPEAVDLGGFRTWGHSKDHREDRPQIVIGMAVTRGGIPIRTWCWPDNTADLTMIEQVRADLRDWQLRLSSSSGLNAASMASASSSWVAWLPLMAVFSPLGRA
jgi:transposase